MAQRIYNAGQKFVAITQNGANYISSNSELFIDPELDQELLEVEEDWQMEFEVDETAQIVNGDGATAQLVHGKIKVTCEFVGQRPERPIKKLA